MRQPTLIINRQPHRWLYCGERCLLPLDRIDPHLVTHTEGGVDGLAPDSFPNTHVCRLDTDDQWRFTCEWIIKTQAIRRIVAPSERFILLAAELRTSFGLPGMQIDTATLFRDKVAMKTAARAAGVTVPDFAPLDAADQLEAVDWSQGMRIVKRRNMVGAMDVHTVATLADARSLWQELDAPPGRYEIETFIHGAMYHCDAVVRDSQITFASVCRYLSRPGDFCPGGMGGSVLVLDGDLRERILKFNALAIGGLGLRDGVTHLEAFHTPADELVFCEVAARPGGAGIIDRINDRCYGVNLIECALLLEAGLDVPEPTGTPGDPAVWGFVGFYPGGSPPAAISASELSALGVVEHEHHPQAGGVRVAPRQSSDYADLYILSAKDEAAFAAQAEALHAARTRAHADGRDPRES